MLFTASTDFVQRTLSKVQSIIGKLLYCAQLRNKDKGEYVHWGLTQMYGREEVQAAIGSNHRELLQVWLTMRMSEVLGDFQSFVQLKGIEGKETLALIAELANSLPPSAAADLGFHCSLYSETLEQLVLSERSRAA